MRQSIDAALFAKKPLSAGGWRVLAAVLREIPSYSRVSDGLSHARVVELTGLSERTVFEAYKNLQECGALIVEPGRGRGRTTRVNLPENRNPELPLFGEGNPEAQQLKSGSSAPENRKSAPPSASNTEKVPEKYLREERDNNKARRLGTNRARHDVTDVDFQAELRTETRSAINPEAAFDAGLQAFRETRATTRARAV